jgi:hypothetical protein
MMSKELIKYLIGIHDGIWDALGEDTIFRHVAGSHSASRDDPFCDVFIRITPTNRLTIEFPRVPAGAEVEQLILSHGGSMFPFAWGTAVSLPFTPTDAPFLRELAEAIRIATPRWLLQPDDPDRKWKTPPLDDALRQLAQVLDNFCDSQSQAAEEQQS